MTVIIVRRWIYKTLRIDNEATNAPSPSSGPQPISDGVSHPHPQAVAAAPSLSLEQLSVLKDRTRALQAHLSDESALHSLIGSIINHPGHPHPHPQEPFPVMSIPSSVLTRLVNALVMAYRDHIHAHSWLGVTPSMPNPKAITITSPVAITSPVPVSRQLFQQLGRDFQSSSIWSKPLFHSLVTLARTNKGAELLCNEVSQHSS